MADITRDIRAALESKLNNMSGIPTIAWENWTFDPPTDQSYVAPRLLFTRREPSVTGPNPQIYYRGVFVVDCYVPSGGQLGPSTADSLAESILNEFEATTDIFYQPSTNSLLTEDGAYIALESGGRTLLDGVVNIHIRTAEREQGRTEGAFYMVPVLISWQTYQ